METQETTNAVKAGRPAPAAKESRRPESPPAVGSGRCVPASSSADSDAEPPKLPDPASPAPHRTTPTCWTEQLVAPQPPMWPRIARQIGCAIGFAAVYGAAVGTRSGGLAIARHAAGCAAALVAVGALGIPALAILLALVDAPVGPSHLATAAGSAAAKGGVLLAGLAPTAALFVVTSDQPASASFAAAVGLGSAAAIALYRFIREVGGAVRATAPHRQMAAHLALLGFGIFSIAMASRVAWATMPLLRGAS